MRRRRRSGSALTLESTTGGIPFPAINTLVGPPTQLNLPLGAPASTTSLGIQRAGVTNLNMEIPFISATGIYDIDSVTVAIGSNGNGYLRFASDEHRWRTDFSHQYRARPGNWRRRGHIYFHCPGRNDYQHS